MWVINGRGCNAIPCCKRVFSRMATAAVIGVSCWATAAIADYEVPTNPAYDPPTGYYAGASGTGTTLKNNLKTIISTGFVSRSYGDARYAFAITDQDPNNSSNIRLVYNDASVSSTWDSGVTYAREHLWCVSWLGTSDPSNSYKGIESDLFELRPINPSINSARSNDPFGSVGSSGSYGINGNYWYPGDTDAGEVARALFYMATRWADSGLTLVNLTGTPAYGSMQGGDLASLLKWNYTHGVDNFERRRNEYIYSSSLNPAYYQGNRNPYIDHPEYVWAVFGGGNNNSQMYVGSNPVNGASSDTQSWRVMQNGTLDTRSEIMHKVGVDPTTYDITLGGDATCPQYGTGQCIDYNTVNRTLSVGLSSSTGSTGLKTGTVTIHNTDLTTSGTGYGSADGDDTINLSAAVVANRMVTASTVDFGVVHVGVAASRPVTLSTASGDDNHATRVSVGNAGPDANGISVIGGANPLFNANTVTDDRTVSGTFSVVGLKNASITLVTTGEGLSGESPINVPVSYTAQVYSGQSGWKASTGGSWGSNSNWQDSVTSTISAAPGTWGVNGDTATFGTAIGSSPATVNLNGANPSLASIAFNNSTAGYTIAQGSGGTLTLAGIGGGNVSISSQAGNHAISAPIQLAGNATITTTSGSQLALSGSIGDGGAGKSLTKTGGGLASLSGANTYTGRTIVASGTLDLGPAAQNAVFNLGGADVQSGMLVFDYDGVSSPAATIKGLLTNSYNGGLWNIGQFREFDRGYRRIDLGLVRQRVEHSDGHGHISRRLQPRRRGKQPGS